MMGRDRQGPPRTGRILIVDDEQANVQVLARLLSRAGYEEVRSTTDARGALELYRRFEPDLLLLDLRMPHLDGFDVMEQLRQEIPDGDYFPILVLTGDTSSDVKQRALASGARDFLNKPFDVTEALLRIENLLQTRHLHHQLLTQNETLEERVRDRTRELAEAQVEILHRLALAAEYRDDITGRHAERVGLLSALLARELGCVENEVRLIRRAATLHDVGKIGIPDAILMKPGPLSPQEFELMKNHTEIGARILSGSRFPLLRMAKEIALAHQDRWDGTGYTGRAGEEIPLVGRIVAVADVFDSLTHERPYKGASPMAAAVAEIRASRGSHFDPDVVEAFETLLARGEIEQLDDMVRASLAEGMDPEDLEAPLRDPG
jgi:putative two-component system response regulator